MQYKITELNTKDTYKLIDVVGWLKSNTINKFILDDLPELLDGFNLDSVKNIRIISKDQLPENRLNGMYADSEIISHDEYDFFKKIKGNKIILVGGKKGSGKNHVADTLKEYLESKNITVDLYAFADPMKEIIQKTFDINLDQLNEMKNEKFPIEFFDGSRDNVTDMRSIIQKFGTEAMQSVFGVKVWKNLADEFIENSKADVVIVTDFRFPNECIDNSYTLNVKNSKTDDVKDNHSSENLLNDFDFDFTIENSNKPSKEKLFKQFDKHNLSF